MTRPDDRGTAAPVDPQLLELLVCPLTKGPLRYDRERQELVSEQAGLAYPIRDGIPIMLVDEARPLDEDDAIPDAVRARRTSAASPMTAPAEAQPLAGRAAGQARREAPGRSIFDDGAALRAAGRAVAGREPVGRGAGPRARARR